MQLQYLSNVAASLNQAIADLKNDISAIAISRWIVDFEGEYNMIVEYEIPAEKCYDC